MALPVPAQAGMGRIPTRPQPSGRQQGGLRPDCRDAVQPLRLGFMETTVRPMTPEDAAEVAAISQEAGYQSHGEEVAQRYCHVTRLPNQGLFVAHHEGELVGWAHVQGVLQLHAGGYAAIVGLAVRSRLRGRGIGQALLRSCRRWAESNGFVDLRLP